MKSAIWIQSLHTQKCLLINFNQNETRDFEQDTYAMCMHHNIALTRTKLGAYKNNFRP
jgi:hypothetical protein